MSGQPRPDEPVMIGKQLRVETFSQPPYQGRRSLNVGKQKRKSLHRHSLEGQPGCTTGHRAQRNAPPARQQTPDAAAFTSTLRADPFMRADLFMCHHACFCTGLDRGSR